MATNTPGCDIQQIHNELADFRQVMLADICKMFERHESTMRHMLDLPLSHHDHPRSPSVASPGHHHSHPLSPSAGTPGSPGSDIKDVVLQDNEAVCPRNGSDPPIVEKEAFDEEEENDVIINHVAGVFGDLGSQDKIDLGEKIYDVANFYKTTGHMQAIARWKHFGNITLFVICANAIYLGVDANNNTESYILDSDIGFQICEHFFCVVFSAELLIRFGAFQRKVDCLRDGWFKFDSFLVTLMVMETWLMPLAFTIVHATVALPTGPLRLLRLLRLSRLVRLIRALPELVTMFRGMFVASRAVGSSLLMVTLLIYVFGIVVHMGMSKEEGLDNKFGTLPRCMWTLLMDGTFMDSTGSTLTILMEREKFNTVGSAIVFLIFILLSAMTVMNMLIGVLCEVVSAVAQGERDEAAIRVMKETILVELKTFDDDGNGMINKAELEHVMKSKQARAVLRSIEVGEECLHELQQMLFYNAADDAEVSIERVMELLLMYRGNLETSVKHLVEVQAFTRWYLSDQMKQIHQANREHTEAYIKTVHSSLIRQVHAAQLVPVVTPASPRRVLDM